MAGFFSLVEVSMGLLLGLIVGLALAVLGLSVLVHWVRDKLRHFQRCWLLKFLSSQCWISYSGFFRISYLSGLGSTGKSEKCLRSRNTSKTITNSAHWTELNSESKKVSQINNSQLTFQGAIPG